MVWLRPDLSSGDILLKPQSVIDVGDAATAIHLPPVACYADKYVSSNFLSYTTAIHLPKSTNVKIKREKKGVLYMVKLLKDTPLL